MDWLQHPTPTSTKADSTHRAFSVSAILTVHLLFLFPRDVILHACTNLKQPVPPPQLCLFVCLKKTPGKKDIFCQCIVGIIFFKFLRRKVCFVFELNEMLPFIPFPCIYSELPCGVMDDANEIEIFLFWRGQGNIVLLLLHYKNTSGTCFPLLSQLAFENLDGLSALLHPSNRSWISLFSVDDLNGAPSPY